MSVFEFCSSAFSAGGETHARYLYGLMGSWWMWSSPFWVVDWLFSTALHFLLIHAAFAFFMQKRSHLGT